MATMTKTAPRSNAATKNGKSKFQATTVLATPTDLKSEEVQAIAAAVNPIIADSFALYVKTKNFHWHLAGSHFRGYHLMFDEHAATILDSIDPLAERLRKIGATTLRSISHISETQTLEDDNDEYVMPLEMVMRLLNDNRQVAAAQRAAIEVCEDNRDKVTGNLLQEILDETERRIWFLFETCQGGENTE